MLRAQDVMKPGDFGGAGVVARSVDSRMPLSELLPRFLDTPGHQLVVTREGERIGFIDSNSLLDGLGRQIPARDDVSVITLECPPADYSASAIARAVEDSDTHLVDLWTSPADNNKISVTLRIRRTDPTPAVHSLARYGYDVTDVYGPDYSDQETALWRMMEINRLLNV